MSEDAPAESTPGAGTRPAPALVGRDDECAALDAMLADARRGAGRFLCLEGEAGIGKTALLGWAVARADDLRVLRVRPSPDIDGLAYSAISDLLAPLHQRGEALHATNALVLNQLIVGHEPGPASPSFAVVDPLTVGAALLAHLEELTRDRPLFVVVDDAHWLDVSSALALAFVANRVEGLALAMVVATRPEGAGRWRDHGFAGLDVAGISTDAAVELLAGTAAPAVARQLAGATHGNPLALLGICDALTENQRWGRDSIESLPDRGAGRPFGGRLGRLSRDARLAVAIVAYDDRLDRSLVVAVCAALGARNGNAAVAEAERQGLIRPEPSGLALVHPLLRSEVDVYMPGDVVRAVNRAIAHTLRRDTDLERRAWHLSRSVEGADEQAAALLVAAAQRAFTRGDPSAAAQSYLRAGELTEIGPDRIDRLAAAGDAFAAAGQSRAAISAFDLALSETNDVAARAGLLLRRMIPLNDIGADENLVDEMVEAIAVTEPVDRNLAAALTVYAAVSSLAGGSVGRGGDLLARARMLSAELDEQTQFVATLFEGIVTVLRGDVELATPMLLALGAMPDIVPTPMAGHVAIGLYWADALQPAEDLVNAAIEYGRSHRAPGAYTHPLITRAEVLWRTGRFVAARADASEARVLATEAGRPILAGYATSMLARAEASLGRVELARELAAEAVGYGGFVGRLWSQSDAGFVELTADNPADAIPYLERASRWATEERIRLLSPSPWGPDLVEAYVRVGRTRDAEELVERLAIDVGPKPNLWSTGALARCAGLVHDDFDAQFEAALLAQQQLPIPFEVARTRLCFGERLRRTRRHTQAAIQLQRAHKTFAEVGAIRWAQRAERELASLGQAAEPSRPPALATLTPKEYQVAALIAQGTTNREAAQSLFLSTRTVEAHLASVYRKLGINSRTQLVLELAANTDGDAARTV